MDISEQDRKVVEESWKELHNKEREREAKIIERIANLESNLTKLDEQTDLNFIQVEETESMILNKLSSLESENKNIMEKAEFRFDFLMALIGGWMGSTGMSMEKSENILKEAQRIAKEKENQKSQNTESK